MTTTATLVADYTTRFSARYLHEHSVGSGLGIWLLLALLAPATEGEDRRRLEAELGTDADDAARRAGLLLADPHPAVLAAVAVWDRPEVVSPGFVAWSAGLPEGVERGPMPTSNAADAWADRCTQGMIPTFPAEIRADVAVLLGSALAADVSWIHPFVGEDAEHLGGAFGESITLGLRARQAHTQLLADTDAVGIVAVHAADARDGLRVVSVIGPPHASPGQTHLAAHQVARLLAGDDRQAHPVDLFDLELGTGHAWTLTEAVAAGRHHGPAQEVKSMLGAWTARSDHDLTEAPGMTDAIAALVRFVLLPDALVSVAARQSAVAEFTREGFRAAAITNSMVLASGVAGSHTEIFRIAEVRFNRPYAVLAIALGPRDRVSSWTDVPVFSAWVQRVVDTPKPADRRQLAAERRAEIEARSGAVESGAVEG